MPITPTTPTTTTAAAPATAPSSTDPLIREEFIRRFLCPQIPDLPTIAESLHIPLDDVLDWAARDDVVERMERIARTMEARSRILTSQSLTQVLDAQTNIATSWHPHESATPAVVNRWMETARRAGGRVIDLYQFHSRRPDSPLPSTPPRPRAKPPHHTPSTRPTPPHAPPQAPPATTSSPIAPSASPAPHHRAPARPIATFSTTPPIAPTPFPSSLATTAADPCLSTSRARAESPLSTNPLLPPHHSPFISDRIPHHNSSLAPHSPPPLHPISGAHLPANLRAPPNK